MRHGRYDRNELSDRLSAFESSGRHLTVSPPSMSIMRDISTWVPQFRVDIVGGFVG
jgi:hypothetical protein